MKKALLVQIVMAAAVALLALAPVSAEAQKVFRPVWAKTRGNDGCVSFEVDPLLEDIAPPADA